MSILRVDSLSKSFATQSGNFFALSNISLSFSSTGLISIVGKSGSGKSTLLNILMGIEKPTSGNGYVFQNFNLLNLDNVETNIILPFESTSNSSKKIKERKVDELTKLLDIHKLKKQNVNKLSGGEKQRVAIARAMANSPKVILCDEPTGALDEKNSKQIYDILRKISSKSLILIASHDIDGVAQIADKIITIDEGKIYEKEVANNQKKDEQNLLENNNVVNKANLSPNFKIHHSLHKIKSKKYRSLITNGMLSLSLTGIGLSIILATSVSNKIEEAFSSLINGNQIVMSLKKEAQNSFSNVYSAPINKIEDIYEKYNYYLDGVGVNYLVNFEDFFKDSNDFYVSISGSKYYLSSLSTRSVNDYRWMNEQSVYYPYNVNMLDADQVVLGLSYQDMTNLCFKLQILRNFSSLGHYIHEHGLFINLEVRNDDWQYDDEQIFEVKAVTESNRSCLLHNEHLWNEVVFEKMMRLPSDDDEEHLFPWEMYKIYYLKTSGETDEFLDAIFYDEEFEDFVFERTNYGYNPSLCDIDEVCKEKRLFVYMVDKVGISPAYINFLANQNPEIKDFYFISDYGYASYASNLLSGFSKNLFVSTSEEKVVEAIDASNEIENENNVQIDLPSDVIQGNYLNGISGGLRFSSKLDKLIKGRKPTSNSEIVISNGLAKLIDPSGDGLGKYLYIAGENNEFITDEGLIEREYKIDKVVIVGIVNEEQNYLYHNQLWTISFFRDKLGVSSFYLIPKSVVIELDENIDSNPLIEKFSKQFHDYSFSSPVSELSSSIESTLNYANAILIGFSILATLISILLLGTVVLLNVLESKDELFLFNVLGIKQKDVNSLFVYQSLIQGLIAFIFSAIELVVVDFVISKALGDTLHTSLSYSFNFLPILVVFAFATILPYLTSLIIIKVLNRGKKKKVAKSTLTC